MFYSNIYLNLPRDVIKHIIGKGGTNFQKMQKENKLNFIWYNNDVNCFTLYGEESILESAKEAICLKINEFTSRFCPELSDNIYNTNAVDDVCTELNLNDSLNKDQIKYLIGNQGSNFKDITKKTNVFYIWFNDDKKSIMIYGTKHHTLRAMQLIQKNFDDVMKNDDEGIHPSKKMRTE